MRKQITIIAGHDTHEEREQHTLAWLAQHGVKVEEWNGLQVIPMQAEMGKGQYQDEYCMVFADAEGEEEQSYLVLSLKPDPHDSRIEIEYAGDYSCTCKGRGCVKCNDELAAMERGENPYAHHVLVDAKQSEEVLDAAALMWHAELEEASERVRLNVEDEEEGGND